MLTDSVEKSLDKTPGAVRKPKLGDSIEAVTPFDLYKRRGKVRNVGKDGVLLDDDCTDCKKTKKYHPVRHEHIVAHYPRAEAHELPEFADALNKMGMRVAPEVRFRPFGLGTEERPGGEELEHIERLVSAGHPIDGARLLSEGTKEDVHALLEHYTRGNYEKATEAPGASREKNRP